MTVLDQDSSKVEEYTQALMQPSQDMPEGIEHGEKVAGLSAWAARNILKTMKPLEKTARKKVHIVEKKAEVLEKVPGVSNAEEMIKQAQDITSADLKKFKTTDTHQVNFDTIEGGEDVTSTIAQMAELNKLEIDEARRGVITDEQLAGLANDLGQDPEFLKDFLARKQGTAVNAESVLASRQLLEQSAVKLKGLAELVSSNQATDIDKLNFSKQWQFHRQFTNQFMGMRAEFGRGLRAFGVSMENLEQAKIQEVMSMVAHDMDINRLADQINTMDTTVGINKLVQAQDSIGQKGVKVFVENFISSILSGVKTQIVNTSGTALRLGMDIPDTMVASLVGKAMPTGQEKILANETLAKIFGLTNGFQDAMQTAWRVAKTAEPYGGIDKLDMMHQKAISSDYLGMQADSVAGKMVDTYGTIIRAPLERVMGGIDGFFKVLSERSQLAAISYRKASQSGLEGAEATKYLSELMESPTPDMITEMEDFALDVTFQKPLGETGRSLQQVVNKSPILKVFMPFIKTPTNLMKQAYLERTPLGLFSQQYKDDVAAGGARAQMARAKMINGTMLSSSALMWAMGGKITGSDPKDAKARNARYETGWRPRSFVFENEDGTKEYISYDRAEPFSYLLGTIADIVEYQEQVRYDDPDLEAEKEIEEAVTGLVSAFAVNTVDKTFMTGVQSIMQVMTDPKRYGKQYVANMMNGVIPFSGVRRDLAKLDDSLVKDAFTIMEKIKKSTPGFNKDLPNKLDNYGDEIQFDTVLNPWPKVTETKDPVRLEVQRLATATRSVAITKPSNRIDGIKLNAQQYHDFVKYARKDLVVEGLNFHETLEDVMNSDFYLDAPTEDARVLILNTVKKSFDEAAKAWLLSVDPELLEKVKNKKERKAEKLIGKEL